VYATALGQGVQYSSLESFQKYIFGTCEIDAETNIPSDSERYAVPHYTRLWVNI